MKNILICFIIVFTFVLFASCEKRLEYRGEASDPVITLTSFNDIYDTLYCCVSKTNFFLESTSSWIVDNPTVRYKVNDGEWKKMTSQGEDISGYSERFISDYVIQPNDEVRLEVSHPDYSTVTSKQVAPEVGKITVEGAERITPTRYSIVVKFYPYESQFDNDMLYKFSTSYRMVAKQLETTYGGYEISSLYECNKFTSTDPLTLQSYGDDNSFFLTDMNEGDSVFYFYASAITEPYEFKFEIDMAEYGGYLDWTRIDYSVDSVEVYLSVVPESYFKYVDTKISTLYESVFSEKVQLYNNIENGVGNFTIRSYAVDSLCIE